MVNIIKKYVIIEYMIILYQQKINVQVILIIVVCLLQKVFQILVIIVEESVN